MHYNMCMSEQQLYDAGYTRGYYAGLATGYPPEKCDEQYMAGYQIGKKDAIRLKPKVSVYHPPLEWTDPECCES